MVHQYHIVLLIRNISTIPRTYHMAHRNGVSQAAGSQRKASGSGLKPRTVKLDGATVSSSAPAKSRRFDPLTAFSTQSAPSSEPTRPKSSLAKSSKGKEKAPAKPVIDLTGSDDAEDFLWVDRYEPDTEADLAVHVRKVADVRAWLQEAFEGGPSGQLRKYRRILALTGPSGTGKTSTVRILAKELGFEILEWRNSISESMPTLNFEDSSYNATTSSYPSYDSSVESLFSKFEAFLTRASSCGNVFSSTSSSKVKSGNSPSRKVILLEDLPNILHQKTQASFHEALLSLVNKAPSNPPVPVVIIISDSGVRGEASDDRISEGRGWNRDKQVIDVRTVLPRELLSGPYVREIEFNPIAPTLMRKALQTMLNNHFSSTFSTNITAPSKGILDIIIESSNGDIRSAINALQFACIANKSGKKMKKEKTSALVMEAVTRREQSLALFHLLGKVLYNKRKNDPPNASATAKDLKKEQDLDASLPDPAKLPAHLSHHDRRTSRVDVNLLYADSPIDSSLFSLYIHQNYTQYCNDTDETDGVADWLSWVDSSGGEAWYQANPHQFHLITLGTLHSLPSPVPRRSQKSYKPEFFACLQKEKGAWEGVRSTREWLLEGATSTEDSGWRVGGWSTNEVILELGGVLKARDLMQDKTSAMSRRMKPPPSHRSFSRMEFVRGGAESRAGQLNERDVDEGFAESGDGWTGLENGDVSQRETTDGGWLESDDIEDF
ncbi:Rad17 cell cycle checkpoint protein-domain-containing protein [Panaeolus papilionaceus]|nr:Rad17 cell cycle checkpoint protein-domain-containing protein [Panaeolus papilionaceus]